MKDIVGIRMDIGARVYFDGEKMELPPLAQSEARHSPTGFEWGYQGSGPAELARAVLIAVVPEKPWVRQPRVYQQFKFDVIARLSRPRFLISSDDVLLWLQDFAASDKGKAILQQYEEDIRLDAEIALLEAFEEGGKNL